VQLKWFMRVSLKSVMSENEDMTKAYAVPNVVCWVLITALNRQLQFNIDTVTKVKIASTTHVSSVYK